MSASRKRSVNSELEAGMIDGSYKQVIKDRGGDVEPHTWEARATLGNTVGIYEAPLKHLPDSAAPPVRTMYTVDTPPAQPSGPSAL